MAAIVAINEVLKKKRQFNVRFDALSSLTEQEIVERYRLPSKLIYHVEENVRHAIARPTGRCHAVTSTQQVLLTLRYLAKGDFYSEVADLHGFSKSTVSKVIHSVIPAINDNIDNINFPTGDDILKTKQDFYKIAKFPGVMGCIDGTLIPNIAPSNEESDFVCRKGFHALNIQAVVDANLRFTNAVCKWPGSVHDSFIFNLCSLNDHLKQAPAGNGWLLGDSGYGLKPYLMTPIIQPQPGREQRYNSAHSRTRVVVEKAFGVLKSRFRCLHKSGGCVPFRPERSMQVVQACMKLHNLCKDFNIPNPTDYDQFIETEVNINDRELRNENDGIHVRQNLVSKF